MEARHEMKSTGYRNALTHLVALSVGALLASLSWQSSSAVSDTVESDHPASRVSPGGLPKETILQRDVASRGAKARPDFAGAWAALSSIPAADRDQVRKRLIEEWIAADPDGALEALVAMDDPGSSGLLECFGPLFEKNPEWFLSTLQTHRHGLRGVVVRDWWTARMAASDPAGLARLARSFGPLDGAYMMSRAMTGATSDQEKMNAVFAALEEMQACDETTRLWKAAGKGLAGLGADALEGRFLEATNPEVKALFGLALAKALTDKSVSPELRSEILGRVPADRRASLALDLAREAGKNSTAITAAIDSLVDSPDWSQNAKALAVQLHNSLPSGADALRLADWAATLPAREDTEDLFRTAVRPFLQQHPVEELREWIGSMPSGWQRDNTLAAWVQSSANFQKLEDARWALERIQSPHFRSEGEKWISAAESKAR